MGRCDDEKYDECSDLRDVGDVEIRPGKRGPDAKKVPMVGVVERNSRVVKYNRRRISDTFGRAIRVFVGVLA